MDLRMLLTFTLRTADRVKVFRIRIFAITNKIFLRTGDKSNERTSNSGETEDQ